MESGLMLLVQADIFLITSHNRVEYPLQSPVVLELALILEASSSPFALNCKPMPFIDIN
jgi:hypothetical protein